MRYAVAKARKNAEEKAYRIYVSDTLKMIAENTARAGGRYVTARYVDIIHPKPEETRSADEIISHIKKKLEVKP